MEFKVEMSDCIDMADRQQYVDLLLNIQLSLKGPKGSFCRDVKCIFLCLLDTDNIKFINKSWAGISAF